jgi:hypothetical protein
MQILDVSTNYIDYSNRPCILRAWNNYHGFPMYEVPTPAHENTLAYFYTLTPPGYSTIAIPSSYFHIAIQLKWIDVLRSSTLFVVNGTHIYCVKKTSPTTWKRFDWPFSETYTRLYALDQSLHHTLFVIFLYTADIALLETLIGVVQTWQPKHTPFYTTFRRRLLEKLRTAIHTART